MQLPGDIKYRAKALIDAVVFRCGSASAAGYYAVMCAAAPNPPQPAQIDSPQHKPKSAPHTPTNDRRALTRGAAGAAQVLL